VISGIADMMSLAAGWGPFGQLRRGSADFDLPKRIRYSEDYPRRVRGSRGGAIVIDSLRVKLLWETGRQPRYCFPVAEAAGEGAPAPGLDGWVVVDFDAMETWHEEDGRVVGHVRDPYHRIDVFPTPRHVRVSLNGVLLAETTRAEALFETALPPRWYMPRVDVKSELTESQKVTVCAYKGFATHWHVRVGNAVMRDLAWSYEDPLRDGEQVRGRIAFYNEHVDLELDGEPQERPQTPFS
jgi:uncharacterized protein (DUF427 family)